jgi:catechol-2,3-dioxygenase
MPGRLQHLVVTTLDTPRVAAFYQEALGFQVSDRVLENGAMTTIFLRSDPEHHSFAAFRTPAVRLDHHSLEVPDWNAIRDWADHMARLEAPISWGPGRHGPGNNLFFMVSDPDGNWVELSAELERMPLGMTGRDWPHTERTLNLWGQGMLRS